jgi:hypothetical protein
MTDVLKQIEELSDKAVKYDNIKQRYLSVATKLKNVAIMIEEAIKELDPVSSVKTRTRTSSSGSLEKIEEQYKKMEMGFQVSLESLHKDYPELEEKVISYIFYNKLSHAPKIMKRKEGRSTTLYIQKTI